MILVIHLWFTVMKIIVYTRQTKLDMNLYLGVPMEI